MIQFRKAVLAGLGVVGLLAGASPVWAQAAPPAQPQAQAQIQAQAPGQTDAEKLQALNSAAVAVALGTQPIPADQLALGGRFVKAMNIRAGLDETFKQALAPARDMTLQGLKNAPPEQKAKFMAALDDALTDTRRDMVDKIIQGLDRYYAARLTAEQLTGALAFYESPLGQKTVRTPDALTEAEKQEAGMTMMRNPAILDVLGATIGSIELSQSLSLREVSGATERFKGRLCAALKPRGIASTGCPKA